MAVNNSSMLDIVIDNYNKMSQFMSSTSGLLQVIQNMDKTINEKLVLIEAESKDRSNKSIDKNVIDDGVMNTFKAECEKASLAFDKKFELMETRLTEKLQTIEVRLAENMQKISVIADRLDKFESKYNDELYWQIKMNVSGMDCYNEHQVKEWMIEASFQKDVNIKPYKVIPNVWYKPQVDEWQSDKNMTVCDMMNQSDKNDNDDKISDGEREFLNNYDDGSDYLQQRTDQMDKKYGTKLDKYEFEIDDDDENNQTEKLKKLAEEYQKAKWYNRKAQIDKNTKHEAHR